MDNKAQKILAAMDVSDGGILTGKEKFSDIQRVKAILPDHYEVKESKSPNAIHCISKIGIRKDGDAEDDEHWGYIMAALKRILVTDLKKLTIMFVSVILILSFT